MKFRADERGRDAAPQPADLRPRRDHRPVHRHQAHRHRRHRAGSVTDASPTASRPPHDRRVHRRCSASSTRSSSPASRRSRSTTRPNGSLVKVRRQGRRLVADRPELHRAEVLPPAPVGRRLRARRAGRRRRTRYGLEPRAVEPDLIGNVPGVQRRRRRRTRTRRRTTRTACRCSRPTRTTTPSPTTTATRCTRRTRTARTSATPTPCPSGCSRTARRTASPRTSRCRSTRSRRRARARPADLGRQRPPAGAARRQGSQHVGRRRC